MQPLAGIRILEFDGLGPVTFAGMMLADLGAEVLRLTRSASAGPAVFDQVGGAVTGPSSTTRITLPEGVAPASLWLLAATDDAHQALIGFRAQG